MLYKNYRGISLNCIGYKILFNIIYERLTPHKASFGGSVLMLRTGKSTTDQIFLLRQILENTTEFQVNTHHLSIDITYIHI